MYADRWLFVLQAENSFSEEEEEKLQAAFSLEKQDLHLVLETISFILEQVSFFFCSKLPNHGLFTTCLHFCYTYNFLTYFLKYADESCEYILIKNFGVVKNT